MELFGVIAGLSFLSWLEYVLQLVLIILRPCKIHYYKISVQKELHLKTLNLIGSECLISGEYVIRGNKKIPYGYFIGTKAVGFIDVDHYLEGSKISIITTKRYYEYLTSEAEIVKPPKEEPVQKEECCKISVYNRTGRFEDLSYLQVKIPVKDLTPFETQAPIVDEIVKIFQHTQMARVFIEGVAGSGKSSVGYCVAKALRGKFTHSFNPTDPGDSFGNVISNMNYESDEPNVIVLEEVDVLLNKIHNNKVVQNQKISTMITDKTTWNAFLDDIVFYKNTVLILTSNTPKEELDKLDPTYLRRGRIDLYYKMNTPIPL